MKPTNLIAPSKRRMGLILLLLCICVFSFPGNIQSQPSFSIDGFSWGLSRDQVKTLSKYEFYDEYDDVIVYKSEAWDNINFTFKYGYLNKIEYTNSFYKKKKEGTSNYNTNKSELTEKYGTRLKEEPSSDKHNLPSVYWMMDSTEILLLEAYDDIKVIYTNKGAPTGISNIPHTRIKQLVDDYKWGSKAEVKAITNAPISSVQKDEVDDVIVYKLLDTEDLYLFFTDGVLSKVWYNNQCKEKGKAQILYKILKSELVAQYGAPVKEEPSTDGVRLPSVYWMSGGAEICLDQSAVADADITYTNKSAPVKISSDAISSMQKPKTKNEFLAALADMGGTFEIDQKDCQVGSAPLKLSPITIKFSIINGVALVDIKEYNLEQGIMTYDKTYNTFTTEKSLGKILLDGMSFQIKWFGIDENGDISFLLYRYTVDKFGSFTQTEELICTYLGERMD